MLFFGLLLFAVPFVLPLISLVRVASLRGRLDLLEETIAQQQRSLDGITKRLDDLRRQATAPPAPDVKAAATPAPPPVARPIPPPAAPPPTVSVEPPPVRVEPPPARTEHPPMKAGTPAVPVEPSVARIDRQSTPVRTSPPPGPQPPAPVATRLDWEQVIGVKMFSAVAGIALVLAAVFFLRYSIDHGWLAPPVRGARVSHYFLPRPGLAPSRRLWTD